MAISFLHKNKLFAQNFFYLATIRFFNIVTKFFLVSYLVRVLGEKTFGLLTWSDALLQYFIIFVNFGFNIFGAKYIVNFKKNKEKLDEFISTVFIIKAVFFIISSLLLLILQGSNLLEADYNILFILLLSVIGDLLFPIWYFQGIENLKPLSISVSIAKSGLIIATLLLVSSASDIYLYVCLYAFFNILMGFLGFLAMKKSADFKFSIPSKKAVRSIISIAKIYFIGNLSTLVFNALTVFLIGLYISLESVTSFDISIKIVFILILPFEILQAVAMPRIANTRNVSFLKKLIIISFLLGCAIFCFLQLFGEYLLLILGGEKAIFYLPVLKKISYLSFVVPVGFMVGQCGLVAFGEDKKYNFSLIFIAILYCITILILKLTNLITFENLILLRIISDYLLLFLLLIQLFRSKIFSI